MRLAFAFGPANFSPLQNHYPSHEGIGVGGGVLGSRTSLPNGVSSFPLRPCLVHPKRQKVFKIPRHIESCGTYMKH